MGVACSDFVSHNWVQVLSIPVSLLACIENSIKDIVRSSVKVPEFNKHLMKARGRISRNVVEITIKMKTVVRKPLMIKINKLRLRHIDKYFILYPIIWPDCYILCFMYVSLALGGVGAYIHIYCNVLCVLDKLRIDCILAWDLLKSNWFNRLYVWLFYNKPKT